MNTQTNESSLFPVRSIRRSLLAGLVLFALGGVLLANRAFVTSRFAVLAAVCGQYDTSRHLLDGLNQTGKSKEYRQGFYDMADVMLRRKDYDEAYEAFCSLDHYADSKERGYGCLREKALDFMSREDYASAASLLKDILFYADCETLYDECQYTYGSALLRDGDWLTGARVLWSIKNYKDAASLVKSVVKEHTGSDDIETALGTAQIFSPEEMQAYLALDEKRGVLKEDTLAVGFYHTVGRRTDGTVLACGDNSCGQCEVGQWRDIAQIAAGAYHTVGLRTDGTVIACGDNSCGQCEVTQWENVVQIVATDYNTAALLEDGTVVTCGFHSFDQVKSWRQISRLYAGDYALAGLAANGEMCATQDSCLLSGNLAAAAPVTGGAVGITITGSVIASEGFIPPWEKALAVYAAGDRAAAILSDLTPSVYDRRKGEFLSLPDGKAMALALSGTHLAVLYDNGHVTCLGDNSRHQCDTDAWQLW